MQATVTVHAHYLIERFAIAGCIEQQQALHIGPWRRQQGMLFGHHFVALAHAHRVDQDQMLAAQIFKYKLQVGRVLHSDDAHAEEFPVDAELLMGSNSIAVR